MASDEEGNVPVFRVSYEQLVERSKKFLEPSSHDTKQKILVNNRGQDTLESRDEGQRHPRGVVRRDIAQEQRPKDTCHHESRPHGRGRGQLLKPKESEDNDWDVLWTEWRDIEKRLEKLCSIWKGASDQLEEIVKTW